MPHENVTAEVCAPSSAVSVQRTAFVHPLWAQWPPPSLVHARCVVVIVMP